VFIEGAKALVETKKNNFLPAMLPTPPNMVVSIVRPFTYCYAGIWWSSHSQHNWSRCG